MNRSARSRVLCVDDDPQLLKSLRWLLARDHEVVLAEGGEQGLQALATGHFDVIVSDQRMPGMCGIEFLKQARALSPRSVRLLLTGHADFPAVQASVNECDVFRYVAKPWDSASLLAIVADALRDARALQNQPPANDASMVDLDIDPTHETVLVFDRDRAVATQVKEALQGTRHVQWCNGIGKAVGALSSGRVAVLVTDIGDGDLQQMDLIRALRRQYPQVVVVVHSKLRDSAVLGQLINEGRIHRYLTRPVGPDLLRRALQSALARHRDLLNHPGLAARAASPTATGRPSEPALLVPGPRSGGSADNARSPRRGWMQRVFG